MFAQVELPVGGQRAGGHRAGFGRDRQRHPPDRAGAGQEGRFEPREVKLGARSDSYVEVLDGVKDGEQVVVAANFLIDAESNLKAAVGGLGGHAGHGGAPKADTAAPATKPPAAGTPGRRHGGQQSTPRRDA